MKNFKCAACGVGNVAPLARAGRVWRYKQIDLAVPETLVVRTCDNCGEEYVHASEAKAFDAAMEPLYRETVREKLVAALIALEPLGSMSRIERALHLSDGYLSKLKQGRAEASPSLVSLLGLVATNQQALATVEAMWKASGGAPVKAMKASGGGGGGGAVDFRISDERIGAKHVGKRKPAPAKARKEKRAGA